MARPVSAIMGRSGLPMSVNFCTPQSMQTAPRADSLLAGATPAQAQSGQRVVRWLIFA
jgi:hypothetical protein